MTCAILCGAAPRASFKIAAGALAALLALSPSGPASARTNLEGKRGEIVQSRPAGVPTLAVVSLSRQRVSIYDAEGRILRAPVSTGRTGYETPAGVYSILQKKVEHHSNLYDDASMPFMQRITWSGIALHAGVLPGRPASHGCIRMPNDFAEQLFEVTKLGMRVVVMRDDIAPIDVAHPALFQPGLARQPELAVAAGVNPVVIDADQPATAPGRTLRAIAAEKAAEAAEAAKKAQEARLAAARLNKEVARSMRALRMARAAKDKADALLFKTEGQLEAAKTPEAVQRAEEVKAQVLLRQTEAQAALEKVEAEAQPLQDEATRLREQAQAAESARAAAEEQSKEAARKLLPISVFISRKKQRLYVRQAREPLFDSPVTIADADQPLGTFVFTALSYTSEETGLRWNAVSLYNGTPEPAPPPSAKAARRGALRARKPSTPTMPPSRQRSIASSFPRKRSTASGKSCRPARPSSFPMRTSAAKPAAAPTSSSS